MVEIVRNLEPRKVYKPRQKFMFAIELPIGIVEATNTEKGDLMHIIR